MRNTVFLLLIFFSLLVKAQTPSIVTDVNGTNLEPFEVAKKFSKSSFWNGKYYYRGKGISNTTLKLCTTDGTTGGTNLVKEFNYPGTLYDILAVKDFLYFVIDNTINTSVSRKELWKTDGTEAGTILIKVFTPSVAGNDSVRLISDVETDENYSINENEIYFAGVSTGEGLELWRTNGTETSTVLVKDVYVGTNASSPLGFTKIGATVYFSIRNNIYPFSELWKTDGTSSGTLPIGTDTVVLNGQIVPLNGKIYFYGFGSGIGIEPWMSDGTLAGTTVLANTSPQTAFYFSGPFRVLKSDNYLIFPQENYAQNSTTNHFWKSDGTPAGTVRISPDNGLPIFFNAIGFKNYTIDKDNFYAYATGKTLYKFNLQANTNQSILLPNSLEGMGNWLKVYNSELWLTYRNSTNGIELWKTDFTTAGMFADINIGSPASNPFGFFLNNNNFYFFANNNTGNKLYSLNKDVVFNGSSTDNWELPSNWDSNTIPTITDYVIIPKNKNVIINSNAFAKNIIVNSPLGLALGNLNIYGAATLGANVTLNNNDINLKGTNSLITGSPVNYIITNGTGKVSVENVDTARGAISLPIGTATNYNPIIISNTGISDTFSINVENGIANTTGGAVNATWNIQETTPGDSNVNINLSWNLTQENVLFNRNDSSVGHYYSGNWNYVNSASVTGTNPYSMSATGITSFSPFSVLNQAVLGTSNFETSNTSLKLYPNPATNGINLIFNDNLEKVSLKIISLTGQTILEKQNLSGLNFSFDISNLNSGLYFIEIKSSETSFTSKFVKQ